MTVERVGRLVIYIVASAVALDLIAQFWGVFVPVFPGIGLFTFLLAPIAIALLLGLAVAWLNKKRPIEATDYYPPGRRPHRRVRLSLVPSFGLVATPVVGLAAVAFLALPIWPYRARGINVYLLTQRSAVSSAHYEQPLLVRVVFAGRQSQYYLNSRRVTLENLPALLKAEFKRRPEWVVYVDADRDVTWEHAAKAMDVVQGLNGRVVLLTPSTKAEASRRTVVQPQPR
jgi:biopolymer transport protein ExbD